MKDGERVVHVCGGKSATCDCEFSAPYRATIRELVEALGEYGQHQTGCQCGYFQAGRPTSDGGYECKYGDKWVPYPKKPDCTCGLLEIIEKAATGRNG